MNGSPMTSLLFPPFEKWGAGGFAFRASAEQMPEQIPLDPPFSKGESRAAESFAANCLSTKRHSAKCRAVAQNSAKHNSAKHLAAKHHIAASLLCESTLFPPLKKGGRGDLLFVSGQSENQGESPFLLLFQRERASSRRSTL